MIINHDLVGRFGFEVYGGAGKALIFALLAFVMLAWRGRDALNLSPWNRSGLLWLIPTAFSYIVTVIAIRRLWADDFSLIWPILTHVGLIASIIGIALVTISLAGIKQLFKTFRRELLLSLAVGVGFYIFLALIYGLWEFLATTVMYGTAWLLTFSGLDVNVLPPRYLILDKFSIEISQWCSGIESIALFTGLYAIIGIIDRSRLNFRKYFSLFVPALIGIFCFNILRVYVLIMAGYFINEHIAFVLFHTYAGMIFFIIYAALFWKLSYRWMLKKPKI